MTLGTKLKKILSNPVFLVLLVASSLRFLGGYSLGFWGAKFFQGKFSEKETLYSVFNMIISGAFGMFAAYSGGWISDAFDKKYPMTKGILNALCVLVAFPFIFVAFFLSNNFFLSISMYGGSYLFAEMWYGPCVSMLPTLFPAEYSGVAISVFLLAGSAAGAISNYLLGYLGDKYETAIYPDRAGNLLTIFVGVSYLGCGIPFIIAAFLYKKEVLKQAALKEMKESTHRQTEVNQSSSEDSPKNA